jgi:hypothetical protein
VRDVTERWIVRKPVVSEKRIWLSVVNSLSFNRQMLGVE